MLRVLFLGVLARLGALAAILIATLGMGVAATVVMMMMCARAVVVVVAKELVKANVHAWGELEAGDPQQARQQGESSSICAGLVH